MNNRQAPERFPVPTKPGVYEGRYGGTESRVTTVQLDEHGQWWPYPYHFSGWRESEIALFQLTPVDLAPDVPEIKDPEQRSRIEWFTDRLLTLSGVNEEEAVRLAREFVLEEGL